MYTHTHVWWYKEKHIHTYMPHTHTCSERNPSASCYVWSHVGHPESKPSISLLTVIFGWFRWHFCWVNQSNQQLQIWRLKLHISHFLAISGARATLPWPPWAPRGEEVQLCARNDAWGSGARWWRSPGAWRRWLGRFLVGFFHGRWTVCYGKSPIFWEVNWTIPHFFER